MTENCIFCKIINKEIQSNFVYEDENIIAINDLNPKAETHILVIPKTHVASLKEVDEEKIIVDVIKGVQKITEKLGITDYRMVINTGKGAGQTVFHLHVHILAGKGIDNI